MLLFLQVFVTQGVVPPLPVACSRVCPGNRGPPVDRDTSTMPRWLKVRGHPLASCTFLLLAAHL